jgi:hypothetical protein
VERTGDLLPDLEISELGYLESNAEKLEMSGDLLRYLKILGPGWKDGGFAPSKSSRSPAG